MLNALAKIKADWDESHLKDTGLAFALISSIAGIYIDSRLQILTIAILLTTMVIPKVLYPGSIVWFGLSHGLGELVSKMLLFLIYCSVIVPIGVMMQLFKQDPLLRNQFKKNTTSVFIKKEHMYTRAEIVHPY